MFRGRPLDDATLSVGERAYTVIGVMPPGVQFTFGFNVLLRIPPRAEESGAGLRWPVPVIRLKRGVPVERADSELRVIEARLANAFGTGQHSFSYQLRSVRPNPSALRQIHAAMAGAALAVLLVACANLANLMFARGIRTRRDLAVRSWDKPLPRRS
jgi:hypothetical protein